MVRKNETTSRRWRRVSVMPGFALGRRVDAFVDAALTPTVVQSARDVLADLRLSVRVGIHLCACRRGSVRFLDLDPDFPPPVTEPALNARLVGSALGDLFGPVPTVRTSQRSDDLVPGWDSIAVGFYDADDLLHAALWMLGRPAGIALVSERLTAIAHRAQELDPLLR